MVEFVPKFCVVERLRLSPYNVYSRNYNERSVPSNSKTHVLPVLLLPLLLALSFALLPLVSHYDHAAFGETPANVDRIDFVRHLDASTAVQAMQNGAFDVYYTPVPHGAVADPAGLDGIDVYRSKGGVTFSMYVNPAVADGVFNPFSYQEARYALHYLIDREGIVRDVLGGNGVPVVSNYGPYERDYILVSKQLGSLGLKYDPALADRTISGVLEAGGAEKRGDGLWYVDGSPLSITIFIRDDSLVRMHIGEYLASELERIGFTVDRTYGDLTEALQTVYSSDPSDFGWHLYTEAWAGIPVMEYDNLDLGYYYAPWSLLMPGFGEPSYWNYENEVLDTITETIYREEYDSLEHRAELVREANMIGVSESVRIFVAIADDHYIAREGIGGLIAPQGEGITSRFNAINAEGKDPLVIGSRHLFQGAWNPVGGLIDDYSITIWEVVSDPAMSADPFSGSATPVRATWSVQSNGRSGDGIDVPAQAIVWDADSHSWRQVGAGTESISKVTFDLRLSNWHHGVPMTVNDILYPMYLSMEWSTQSDGSDQRYEAGHLHDLDLVKGVRVIDADTVEVYLDYWSFRDDAIAEFAVQWSGMPWEIYAAMEQVVIDGNAAFSRSAAASAGVSWLSLIDTGDSALIRGALAGFAGSGYVPPAVLGGHQDDPQARYDAAMAWIDGKGHSVISNGPFYMDRSPTEDMITVRAFDDGTYPLAADHWGYLTQRGGSLEGSVTIGMLAPLTGGAQRYGVDVREAAGLAVSDFNSYLQERGEPWSLALDVRDTRTDPSAALAHIRSLGESGTKIVNGPTIDIISDELMDYARGQDMLLLSCCSALPSRAVPDDGLFRMIPDHTHHAAAIMDVMRENGAEIIVPAGRDDPWVNELLQAVREQAVDPAHGIVMTERVAYAGTLDGQLESAAAELASAVQGHVEAYGAGRVAVLYVGFEEAARFVRAASTHDILAQVQWFGADLNTMSPNITDDAATLAFASEAGLLSVQPAVVQNDLTREIEAHVTGSAGRAPSVYANFGYDAVWVLGLSILDAGSAEAGAVREILPSTAQRYVGAIGSAEMNDAGDLADGHYAVWRLSHGQWISDVNDGTERNKVCRR